MSEVLFFFPRFFLVQQYCSDFPVVHVFGAVA
jgi:hypothetical protein